MMRRLLTAFLSLLARIGLIRPRCRAMTCRLCKQPKPLKKSHVISEFLYQDMYDEKHRFFGLSSNVETKDQLAQKGFREPLLCEDCEQQIGRYERYASGIFYGGAAHQRKREENLVHLSGLEYHPLKLFFLSLLWRMGITSIPELKGLELGKHEEILRDMLHREDPGDALAYPCLITAVMVDGKHVPDLITHGGVADMDGSRVWSFVAAGFVFSFFEFGMTTPVDIQPAFLSRVGTAVLSVQDITKISFLHEQLIEIAEAKRRRDAAGR
jgi:hypothetical protein